MLRASAEFYPGSLTDNKLRIAYLHTQLIGNSVSAVTESEVKNVRLDVKDRPAANVDRTGVKSY